jgi:hypothetical protein
MRATLVSDADWTDRREAFRHVIAIERLPFTSIVS